MSDWGQLRICVEKIVSHERNHYSNLKFQANSYEHYHKLRAAFFVKKVWPKNSVVTITFLGDGKNVSWTPLPALRAQGQKLDPLEKVVRSMSVKDAIRKIVTERFSPILGIHFHFIESGHADVRIGFDLKNGCWSLVGTDSKNSKDKSTMNFAWLDVGTIMHEFGHVCGMIHEHQNPRGNPIDWNKEAVYEWASSTQGWDKKTTQEDVLNRYKINQINGSRFDPNSIMLYFFPSSLTLNHKGTHANKTLSELDVMWLSKMYPGGNELPPFFYKKVYGMDWHPFGTSHKLWMFILLGIAIIALILGIIFSIIFVRRRKRLRHNFRQTF